MIVSIASLMFIQFSSAAADMSCPCDEWIPKAVCEVEASQDIEKDWQDAQSIVQDIGIPRLQAIILRSNAGFREKERIERALTNLHAVAKTGIADVMVQYVAIVGALQPPYRPGFSPTDIHSDCWFRKAADLGHLYAMYMLGRKGARDLGNGFAEITDQALFEYAKDAATEGFPDAEKFVRTISDGVSRVAACGTGDAQFLRECAFHWRWTRDKPGWREKSDTWLEEAAAKGDSKAQLWLGTHYIERDNQRARDYLLSAVAVIPEDANLKLGDLAVCLQDAEAAKTYYEKAGEAGSVEAQYAIDNIDAFGVGDAECQYPLRD